MKNILGVMVLAVSVFAAGQPAQTVAFEFCSRVMKIDEWQPKRSRDTWSDYIYYPIGNDHPIRCIEDMHRYFLDRGLK